MDVETQRGLTQVLSGTCWIIFGVVLMYRSLSRYGLFRWPVRWHLLSGMAMFVAGFTQFAHGMFWLDWGFRDVFGWKLVGLLWIQLVVSGWTLLRWLKDPLEPNGKNEVCEPCEPCEPFQP